MTTTATIAIRTDKDVKTKSQKLFAELGMDTSTAINIFLRQTLICQGLPFSITKETPNAITKKALEDAENNENILGPYQNFDELLEEDLNA